MTRTISASFPLQKQEYRHVWAAGEVAKICDQQWTELTLVNRPVCVCLS